ncbi:ribosomal protein S6 kinase delta-1 [Anopheles ziemanni]|uniref:ribosomal protein S6 kinase delta-1 n=1 Tax=Anopheles coustani TaxID=139045 RepID=UPI00265B0C4D|nr:ribosomal protein S6 kinase delta-1 [Anopheles coustani]XP_058171920.1 ribosomal protein S6 kinase delta-1 [Anopheles ziemanni]
MLVGRRKAETWVHSFSVGSETRKYKGFTIYRITSIVFPRSAPEALTRVTLWKRFSMVKRLYKELARRHRERHLPGTIPSLVEQSYFKRFDPAVIEERKRYILQLLECAGQEPVLYLSHAFVSFFARGISPDEGDTESLDGGLLSVKENGTSDNSDVGNIETIRQTLGIRVRDELSLIDPSRDGETTATSSTSGGEEEEENVETDGPIMASPMNGSMVSSLLSETGSLQSEEKLTVGQQLEKMPPEETMDYLVAAAMVFSKAVEAEANGEYQLAFEHYKAGIDRLLSGAKDDANVTRRKIAKEKSCKYVSKAEEIYELHLQQTGAGGGSAVQDLGPISYEDPSSPIQLLERPLNYLSRYKVVKVIGTVMQVQDVTDKKFYIMKSIRRPPPATGGTWLSSAAVFPQDVPYMVPLVAYFHSTDGSIFLLLRLVCAGKLWDFIRTYRKQESYCPTPEELAKLTTEDERRENSLTAEGPPVKFESDKAPTAGEQSVMKDLNSSGCDSGFLELVNEYSGEHDESVMLKTDNASSLHGPDDMDEMAVEAHPDVLQQEDEQEIVIPSFDALSKDMDVRELVSCSQQLLKAVTQTLEESEPNAKVKSVLLDPPSIPDPAPMADGLHSNRSEMSNSIHSKEQAKSHSSQLGLVGVVSISEANGGGDAGNTPDLLPEGSVRRWISELVIAVDSLHFNGIVCGDLTMDNLLLGPEGQLILTYFHRRGESYFSQAGISAIAPKHTAVRELYVAPERPLEPKSDFWSVGVIMFEMLTKRKFVSCHPSGVFSYHEVQYPEGIDLSDDAKELLEELLQPEVERRYDFKQIIASPFFRSVDWSEVKRRGQISTK